MWVLGIQIPVFTLVKQVVYLLSHLPSTFLFIFIFNAFHYCFAVVSEYFFNHCKWSYFLDSFADWKIFLVFLVYKTQYFVLHHFLLLCLQSGTNSCWVPFLTSVHFGSGKRPAHSYDRSSHINECNISRGSSFRLFYIRSSWQWTLSIISVYLSLLKTLISLHD